ncbi:MAG: bifunctional hydroxymethylpyrimidine kinase/phosphomethylpyrimidine kinase [Sphingomonadales bacterium]
MVGRVLIVAGSDSGGGAGIQADIKTVTALTGFAATAITALTAQNTRGLDAIHAVPADFVGRQMRSVLRDIGADCIKTGMLWSAEIIETVAGELDRSATGAPLVVDPLICSSSGTRLLERPAQDALVSLLVRRAMVVTPNLAEAEVLTGLEIATVDDMKKAASLLLESGPKAVLLTGGHLAGDVLSDVLVGGARCEVFQSSRIDSRNTHGTGCTLASAIATGIAQGMSIRDSVIRARAYVREAIRSAPGLGQGDGPLNHGHTVHPFEGYDGRD